MKKEMSLRISLKQRFALCMLNMVTPIARVMSDCLEEEVPADKTLRILHAVVAFTVLVFSYGSALMSVLFLVWFVLTLVECKRAGIR